MTLSARYVEVDVMKAEEMNLNIRKFTNPVDMYRRESKSRRLSSRISARPQDAGSAMQ